MTNARWEVRNLLSIPLLTLMGLLLSVSAWGQSATTILSTNFGMQCGTGVSTNCPNYTLPTTTAQPGLFRLWDSGTYWAILQPKTFTGCSDIQQVAGVNTYCWDHLDSWLNAIAASTTIKAVIYTFGGVPCQLVNEGGGLGNNCGDGPGTDPNGLAYAPNDLTTSGSTSFNNFVTNLVGHCSPSPNNNCVATIIKGYEMWNEPNGAFWYNSGSGGTETQLEDMVFPARSIIWTNVSNAVVMTPGFAGANSNYETWFQDWLNDENTNGTLSNDVAFHVYLANQTPEAQYLCYISPSTSSAASTCNNSGQESFLYIKDNTTGWSSKPWLNTETNFNGSNFACSLTGTGATDDCAGEVVRWQLLQDSSAAASVDWYYWNTTVGGNATYEPAYYYMMQYLIGGKFSATCSNPSGTLWGCTFTDANSNSDAWVWTTSTTAQLYTPPSGYINYWIVEGTNAGTCAAIPSTGFTVTYDPYLLVKTSCSVVP
jgi:hypothetical protein